MRSLWCLIGWHLPAAYRQMGRGFGAEKSTEYVTWSCVRKRCPEGGIRRFPPEQEPPARWVEGFRKARPSAMPIGPLLCWRYVGEGEVCIRERGHDDGKHEPKGAP